jgi:hypothetical protein
MIKLWKCGVDITHPILCGRCLERLKERVRLDEEIKRQAGSGTGWANALDNPETAAKVKGFIATTERLKPRGEINAN